VRIQNAFEPGKVYRLGKWKWNQKFLRIPPYKRPGRIFPGHRILFPVSKGLPLRMKVWFSKKVNRIIKLLF